MPEKGGRERADDAVRFVVYQYFKGEEPDLDDAQTIIAMTPETTVLLPDGDDDLKGMTFCVTSLDRQNRESAPARLKL